MDGHTGARAADPRSRELHPRAKRGLLVDFGAWGDPPTAAAIRHAMAVGDIDYYVLKPWRDHDELFHRTISEFFYEWSRSESSETARDRARGAAVHAPWLRAAQPARCATASPTCSRRSDSAEGHELLAEIGPRRARPSPVVLLHDGRVLVDPTNSELAHAYGVSTELEQRHDFDVVIVGAGPAGLAAAVYAAAEGLDALGDRARGHRRPGGYQLTHPQLPRLLARRQRRRARAARVPASVGVRRRLPAHEGSHRARASATTVTL